jgi:hypothetical protein
MTADDTRDGDRQLAKRGIRLFDPFPAAELAALAADVRAVRTGFRPSEAALAEWHLIGQASFTAYRGRIPCLTGTFEGELGSFPGLAMFAPGEGWARLLKGFVRIEPNGPRRRR